MKPDKPLDPKFDVKNLAILLTDHLPHATPTRTINDFSINAVISGGQAKPRLPTPKRFQQKIPIQCDACQTNGHCIQVNPELKEEDLRVCRIGGQVENYLNWKGKHPELAKINAKLYRAMNKRMVINTVRTRYPNLELADENLEEFHDICEEIMFKDNISDDLQES